MLQRKIDCKHENVGIKICCCWKINETLGKENARKTTADGSVLNDGSFKAKIATTNFFQFQKQTFKSFISRENEKFSCFINKLFL